MSTVPKVRQPRLRASCDGCFQAKVKCSKTRPICTRCLSTGIECRYSPSSRAGKPRADILSGTAYPMAGSFMGGVPEAGDAMFLNEQYQAQMYAQSEAWAQGDALAGDLYSMGVPWSPTGLPLPGLDSMPTHPSHSRSLSLGIDLSPHLSKQWLDHPDMPNLSTYTLLPSSGPVTSYFSQSSTSSSSSHPHSSPADAPALSAKNCACFSPVAEALHELNSAASLPAAQLETILVVNKKAVGACAGMLSCSFCMTGQPVQPTAMLLGTVLGRCLALYGAALQVPIAGGLTSPFQEVAGFSLGEGVGGGGAGRFPLEFVAGELKRVEDILGLFQEMCSQVVMGEWPDVGASMVGYLGGVMQQTVAVFNLRKREAGYPV